MRIKTHPIIVLLISTLSVFFGLFQREFKAVLYISIYILLLNIFICDFKRLGRFILISGAISTPVGLISLLISGSYESGIMTSLRIILICLCGILSSAIDAADFSRCLQRMGVPKIITLGVLVTVNFFPVFVNEIKRIVEAIRMRGVNINIFSGEILYRSIMIPTIIRMINVSDTLALSVETRGFGAIDKTTQLRKITIGIFEVVIILGSVLTFVLV